MLLLHSTSHSHCTCIAFAFTLTAPQDRVTDHRCGVVHHNLEEIMISGEEAAESLDEIHDALDWIGRMQVLQNIMQSG
eukprot:645395-Pelagomonas_calceolata.AAC.2